MLNIKSWFLIVAVGMVVTACTATPVAKEPQVNSQLTASPSSIVTSTALPINPPATCPITQPAAVPFTPPPPYPATPPASYVDQFWYGTQDLWTMLGDSGTWSDLPHNESGYTQKIFWWREGYDMSTEPNPALTVTGTRLDASTPPFMASGATNASADFGEAMLMGVDIPTAGCWKITGHYKGHELSFVVWVAP